MFDQSANQSALPLAANAGIRAGEELDAMGVEDDAEWDQEFDKVFPKHKQAVSQLSDEELDQEYDRFIRENAAVIDEMGLVSFKDMFGFLDILFLLFAVGSAYRVASSGLEE